MLEYFVSQSPVSCRRTFYTRSYCWIRRTQSVRPGLSSIGLGNNRGAGTVGVVAIPGISFSLEIGVTATLLAVSKHPNSMVV